MTKIKQSLNLLIQLRDSLQSNQGMTAEKLEQAKAMLEQAISVLEDCNNNLQVITAHELLALMGKVVGALPSIIELFIKHWH
jgi:hypothetical protein